MKFFYSNNKAYSIKLRPDLSLCDKFKNNAAAEQDNYNKCADIVQNAYNGLIQQKCDGYIKTLSKCLGKGNIDNCKIELSNVDGCAHAIAQSVVDDWEATLPKQTQNSIRW